VIASLGASPNHSNRRCIMVVSSKLNIFLLSLIVCYSVLGNAQVESSLMPKGMTQETDELHGRRTQVVANSDGYTYEKYDLNSNKLLQRITAQKKQTGDMSTPYGPEKIYAYGWMTAEKYGANQELVSKRYFGNGQEYEEKYSAGNLVVKLNYGFQVYPDKKKVSEYSDQELETAFYRLALYGSKCTKKDPDHPVVDTCTTRFGGCTLKIEVQSPVEREYSIANFEYFSMGVERDHILSSDENLFYDTVADPDVGNSVYRAPKLRKIIESGQCGDLREYFSN